MAGERKVAYVFSKEFLEEINKLPRVKGRASYVHSLIEAYGLLNDKNISVLAPEPATGRELASFHTKDYVKCLQNAIAASDDPENDQYLQQYGIGFDCPVFDDFYECLSMVAGGTLKAAECLTNGSHSVAINWGGGWHHAHRDGAAGFCYVNDIVLGILKLKEKFNKILYVDLDLHHGDGVQEAFFHTSSVFTVSFHKFCPGFFPGSGSKYETGAGIGRNHCLNIPLLDGIPDKLFAGIVKNVVTEVVKYFKPTCLVVQCGADGMAGDPMNALNITQYGMGSCIHFLSNLNIPTMLVGGGGYNFPNVARCWTYLTAITLGKLLRKDIPEHEFFEKYGPGYTLEITPHSFRENENSTHYLKGLAATIKENFKNMAK